MISKMMAVSIFLVLNISGMAHAQYMRNTTLQSIPIIGLFKTYEINGRLNWIGPFATILINDVKDNPTALQHAKSVRVASFYKTAGIILTPTFLFSAVGIANDDFDKQKENGVENPKMPGMSKALLGLAAVSFISFIAGDIAENAFLTKTADSWSSTYGADMDYSEDGFLLSVRKDF